MPSILETARGKASQLAAEGSAPSSTARHLAFALNPLTRLSASAPRQGGRTAPPANVREQRAAILNQLERASSHVQSTGQPSTTAAPDREAAQHAPPSSPPPSSSPPLSSPSEPTLPDLRQTTPSSGWTIAGLWRKARGIDLEGEAERNPIGFLGILIALASLIVAVLGLVWTVIQGIASLALEARSNLAGEVTRLARRSIEATVFGDEHIAFGIGAVFVSLVTVRHLYTVWNSQSLQIGYYDLLAERPICKCEWV